jgi:exoribonuclease R
MNDQIIHLLAQKDYVAANVPELLRLLQLAPNQQQELQAVLAKLEQTGEVARIKGNRYVQPREADLIPGRIRMNRAGNGFLQPDDTASRKSPFPKTPRARRCTRTVCWCGAMCRKNFAIPAMSWRRPARWCAFSNVGARRSSARCSRANSFFT